MPCADGSGMQVRYETTNELALVSLSFLFLGLPRVGRAAEQAFEDAALLGRGLGLFFDLVHVFLALAKPKGHFPFQAIAADAQKREVDRKSTRLNSSHVAISYAVFCLKKKKPPH